MTNPAELFVDGHRFIDVGERILEGRYLVRVLRSHCAGCGGTFEQLRWAAGPAAKDPLRHCLACGAPPAAPPAQEAPAPALPAHTKARHKRRVPDAVAPPPMGVNDVVYFDRATGQSFTVGIVIKALFDHGSMTSAMSALGCSTYEGATRVGKVLARSFWVTRNHRTNAYTPTREALAAVRERARAGDRP